METFTLVVWFWAHGSLTETKTLGLSESECKLQAAQVHKSKRARCQLEKDRIIRAVPPCANCGRLPGRKLV
jgi:hypothetical protein